MYNWKAPEAATGSPRSWNLSSPMESSQWNISEGGRKIKPTQKEATTAIATTNQNSTQPSSPQEERGQAAILSRRARGVGGWGRGQVRLRLSHSSGHVGLIFRISDLLWLHRSCYYVPENTSQSKGTHKPILSTRLADLKLDFHCCQEKPFFKSEDSLLSWRFPICNLLPNCAHLLPLNEGQKYFWTAVTGFGRSTGIHSLNLTVASNGAQLARCRGWLHRRGHPGWTPELYAVHNPP